MTNSNIFDLYSTLDESFKQICREYIIKANEEYNIDFNLLKFVGNENNTIYYIKNLSIEPKSIYCGHNINTSSININNLNTYIKKILDGEYQIKSYVDVLMCLIYIYVGINNIEDLK